MTLFASLYGSYMYRLYVQLQSIHCDKCSSTESTRQVSLNFCTFTLFHFLSFFDLPQISTHAHSMIYCLDLFSSTLVRIWLADLLFVLLLHLCELYSALVYSDTWFLFHHNDGISKYAIWLMNLLDDFYCVTFTLYLWHVFFHVLSLIALPQLTHFLTHSFFYCLSNLETHN